MPTTHTEPQRGRPFQPGQSGNPAGRPKGARNRATLIAEAKIEEKFGAVMDKLLERALDGNVSALRFCASRVLPEQRPVAISLAGVRTIEAALEVSEALFDAVAAGDLSAQEAQRMRAQLDAHMKLAEREDPDGRVTAFKEDLKTRLTQMLMEQLHGGELSAWADVDEGQGADPEIDDDMEPDQAEDGDAAELVAVPGERAPDGAGEWLEDDRQVVANHEIYSGIQREWPSGTGDGPGGAADAGEAQSSRAAFIRDDTVPPPYGAMPGRPAVPDFRPAMAHPGG